MPYDEKLAGRVRDALAGRRGVTEKKMFGGLSFLLNGNMCCGVARENLVVRVGPDQYEKALSKPSARPMDFTGRALQGFVYVSPTGVSDRDLAEELGRHEGRFRAIPPEKGVTGSTSHGA